MLKYKTGIIKETHTHAKQSQGNRIKTFTSMCKFLHFMTQIATSYKKHKFNDPIFRICKWRSG